VKAPQPVLAGSFVLFLTRGFRNPELSSPDIMTRWKNGIRVSLHYTLGDEAVAVTERLMRRARHLRAELAGAIEYTLHPERGIAWGGPFNGQRARQDLFLNLVERFAPVAVVETGTYLGTTTEFLADTGLPIFSIERDPHYYGFARARHRRRRNVRLLLGDSRAALRMLLDGPLGWARNQSLFIYLDAHWNDNLPLAEELAIVFALCRNAIVMVDDFQVPFDTGYGYDDYGTGKSLTADYIEPVVAAHSLGVFYPSTPSLQETGAQRGCVVIGSFATDRLLASLSLLRPADGRSTPTQFSGANGPGCQLIS
jgi:predicted O-methyltransferase YrrM